MPDAVGVPTPVEDIKIGDKLYTGGRRIAEVADIWPEFDGYTIMLANGNHLWFPRGHRVRVQKMFNETLPNSCTIVCELGHERKRFSRSSDGGWTFICVRCLYPPRY